MSESIDISCPAHAAAAVEWWDRRTDGRTLVRFIDPSLHAGSVGYSQFQWQQHDERRTVANLFSSRQTPASHNNSATSSRSNVIFILNHKKCLQHRQHSTNNSSTSRISKKKNKYYTLLRHSKHREMRYQALSHCDSSALKYYRTIA